LTVILLGFNNGRAGRMAPFAHARRVAALSWCGELPRVRASAAAAVCYRTKASGCRVVRRVPRGRVASAFCLCARFAAGFACAVTRRQARGALGAPLKT
jgi:hypothetical protein